MLLTKKAYQDFQRIYEQEYGEQISIENAIEKGDRLLRYVSCLRKHQTSQTTKSPKKEIIKYDNTKCQSKIKYKPLPKR